MTFKIGIISDIHGLLRPEALRYLAQVDHIIHGGDIGDPRAVQLEDKNQVDAIGPSHRPGYWFNPLSRSNGFPKPGIVLTLP
jgi:hypothetical protein